jgi:hypothetical protein
MYMQHLDLLLQHQIKHLKHTSKTPETLENIRLQHAYIVIATYATSHIYFCNIQIRHLKHKVWNT